MSYVRQRFALNAKQRACTGAYVFVPVAHADMVAGLTSETAIDCYIGVGFPNKRTAVRVLNWSSGLLDDFIFAKVFIPARWTRTDLVCEIRVGGVPTPMTLESLSTQITLATGDNCGPNGATDGQFITHTIDSAGGRADPNREWVHGQVMRVPAGSWMLDNGEDENVVTHVAISTPYPGLNDDHENPYLLYSTDEGDSWRIWYTFFVENGSSDYYNPIHGDPDPGDGNRFNSDVGLAYNETTGDLVCIFRGGSVSNITPSRIVISPAVGSPTLANATVSALSVPTMPDYSALIPDYSGGNHFITPTLARENGILYCFFGAASTTDATTTRSVIRVQSDDDGATFTAPAIVLTYGPGLPYYEDLWHIGLSSEKIDGYWWLLGSAKGTGSTPGFSGVVGEARLFRARSLANWENEYEADHQYLVDRTGSSVTITTCYQGNIFLGSDESTVRMSMFMHDGSRYDWFCKDISLTPETMAAADWWGSSRVSASNASPTPIAFVDLEFGPSTPTDLSRNDGTVTLLNSPAVVGGGIGSGVGGGIKCTAANSCMQIAATLAGTSVDFFVEADIETDSDEDTTQALLPIWCDRSATAPTSGGSTLSRENVPLRCRLGPDFAEWTLQNNASSNHDMDGDITAVGGVWSRRMKVLCDRIESPVPTVTQDISSIWIEGQLAASDATPAALGTLGTAGNNRFTVGGWNPAALTSAESGTTVYQFFACSGGYAGDGDYGFISNGDSGRPIARGIELPRTITPGVGSSLTQSLIRN